MRKRMLMSLASILMIISLMAVNMIAPYSVLGHPHIVSIAPQTQDACPGDTVTIDVMVDAEDHIIKGCKVEVEFDDSVMTTTLDQVTGHNLIGGMEIGPIIDGNIVKYDIALIAGQSDVSGSVLTIEFTIDGAAAPGTYDFTLVRAQFVLEDETQYNTDTANGSVTIIDCTTPPDDVDGDGYTVDEGDCDDDDASIYPGAPETCDDGIDQDCNGSDLSCDDVDDDGDGVTENEGDCDDDDVSIYPDAPEICDDGIDQDCDGSDCTTPPDDVDGDGYTVDEGDCDDTDDTIYPGAPEICDDGIDQDCDGSDCTTPPDDVDGDGYTVDEGDCDDTDDTIYPGAPEICDDGIDQDCNDTDCTTSDYTVTFTAGSGGSLSGNTSQMLDHGGDCSTVFAQAGASYQFSNWTIVSGSGNGSFSNLNQASLSITNVTGTIQVTANFSVFFIPIPPTPIVPDTDKDGISDTNDNCPDVANADQANADDDNEGDACDECPDDPANDYDGDGICAPDDNCGATANEDQADADSDGKGDACDDCPDDATDDTDGDGVCDSDDPCPNDATDDTDGDGVCDSDDSCPNDDTDDTDEDGVCDSDDNCPDTPNADQADSDGDGIGDACSTPDDNDGDGVANADDNCPDTPNDDQADSDGDGIGDACSTPDDNDGDGVANADDNCPDTPNTDQADSDGDGIGDACSTPPKTSYTLTVAATPSEGGSTDPVSGDYTYPEGTEVTITAVPEEDWELDSWSGDASGTDLTITITMNSAKSITAAFDEEGSPVNMPLIGGIIVVVLAVLATLLFFLATGMGWIGGAARQ